MNPQANTEPTRTGGELRQDDDSSMSTCRRARILHLEDNAADVQLCQKELERAGWNVTVDRASTREEFSVRLWASSYDLVLADFQLPDWRGTEAVEALRKLRRDIPVILVTGSVADEHVAEVLRSGVADYVLKDRLLLLPVVVERVMHERLDRQERKRLAEERDRFFMLSSDLLCIIDRQGNFVQLNPAWHRALGVPIEELVKQPVVEWIHPQDRVRCQEALKALSQGATSLEFETRCQAAEGAYRWLQWRASSMPRQPLIYGTARDITARRVAELSLQASEARKAAITEACPDAIINLDADGRILEFNPAATRIFGWKSADVLGRDLLETILPSDIRSIYRVPFGGSVGADAKSTLIELEQQIALTGRRSDGKPFPLEMVLTGTRTCDPAFFIAFIRDITQRKAAEERIRDQAALLDKANEAIWVEDLEGRIQYWNRSAERVYGWSQAEVFGAVVEELLGSRDQSPALGGIRQALQEKGEWRGELLHQTKQGKKITILSQRTLVRTQSGDPKSVLVINADVSDRKVLEAQLLRAQRIESIGTLANGIAHDLNNVLTPILMAVDILQESVKDARTQKLLNTVHSSASHGAGMVKQILAFSRGVEGEKVSLNLALLIRQIRDLVRDTFPKYVQFSMNTAQGLWMVKGDATQLHQVLLNLCVNARDAMPKGGKLTVEASNRDVDEHYARLHLNARSGPYVVLSVSDTGSGIPPEVIDKIFEPFFTTKEVGKGTGLGLSTVLAIVKGHDGFLNVYSEPGKGSRFSIYLPAVPSEGTKTVATENPAQFRGQGEYVLVIDDESSFREITKSILEKYNYHVVTANEGTEALAILARERGKFHLVISDMMMPVLDGASTLRALRKLDPNLKLIATSGMPVSDKFQPLENGERIPFLLKPYPTTKLLQTVRNVLNPGLATEGAAGNSKLAP